MNSHETVRTAALLWVAAVASGVAEAVLAVGTSLAAGASGAALAPQVAPHVAAYAIAGTLIVFFARRRNWARVALTVLLTGVGLATLVIPLVQSLAGGAGPVEALGGSLGPPFAIIRAVHIGCVVAASVVMYTPAANRAFRPLTKVGGTA